MRAWTVVILLLTACAPGCEGCSPGDRTGERAASQATGAPSGDEQEPVEPGPPPTLSVHAERAEPDEPGEWVPVIQNRGADAARIAARIAVERDDGGTWREVATLALRWSCERPPSDECWDLVPGGELRPPAWLGLRGEAQCACADCKPAPGGRYRFVARSCGGAHAMPGEPFPRGR
jgi:hypothetical protein